MKIISYKSAENRPLYAALNDVMTQRRFTPVGKMSRPDMAAWEQALGGSMSVWVDMTLSRTLAPDTWSIDPIVVVDSRFVAEQSARLRLDRDCWGKPDDWVDPDVLQILRFLPGYLRWQDDLALSVKVFRGRPETLAALASQVAATFDDYVQPVLEQMSTPLGAAEFHEHATSGFLAKRGPAQPSYSVTNPIVGTALLFVEAGYPDRALAVLERAMQEKAAIQASFNEVFAAALFCKIEKLMRELEAAG